MGFGPTPTASFRRRAGLLTLAAHDTMPTKRRQGAGSLPPRHEERLTEQRNPRTRLIDRLPIPEALALIHAEDRRCCEAAESVAPEVTKAVELVVEAFRAGGRLIYVGAGTSGRLGVLDAAEQPPTFGAPPDQVIGLIAGGAPALTRSIEGAEDRAEDGLQAVARLKVGPRDVVMGIASGGRTPYVLGALAEARRRRARTIWLACTPALEGEAPLAGCQIRPLVGPEVIAGSTRMKAGTVTKLILNQISTLAMIQMGKVYQNLMVDLRAVNAKLEARALRILKEVTGLDDAGATRCFGAADGELKVALIMALAGCPAEAARRRLKEAAGHVAAAIRSIRSSGAGNVAS